MAIEKGKSANLPDVEMLKKKVEEYKIVIAFGEEELNLRKDMLKVQLENPTPLKPNFAFEQSEDYVKMLKKQWEFDLKKHTRNIEVEIQMTNDKIKSIEDEIERIEKVKQNE